MKKWKQRYWSTKVSHHVSRLYHIQNDSQNYPLALLTMAHFQYSWLRSHHHSMSSLLSVAMKEFLDQQLVPYHYSSGSYTCSCWGNPVWRNPRLFQIRLKLGSIVQVYKYASIGFWFDVILWRYVAVSGCPLAHWACIIVSLYVLQFVIHSTFVIVKNWYLAVGLLFCSLSLCVFFANGVLWVC